MRDMAKALKRLARKNGLLYVLYNLPRLAKGYYPIFLDYAVRPVPRYGYGKPPHPELYAMFAADREQYRERLRGFLRFQEQLARIPLRQPRESAEPSWINKWLEGLDTVALYGFVAERKPRLYLEVGSGYSTKLVRRAIRDHGLATKVVSIDPHPRAEIDSICDQIIRQRLEDADLSIFAQLEAGDILFLDSSHRSFMNSDVTVFFLEVLPRLKPGVLVHLHDIHLPYDYMPERAEWYYSEQYLLAASLVAGHANYRVLLPNAFIAEERDLVSELKPLFGRSELAGVRARGWSFWLEITPL
jgi:predicted O-methyltransferase YrrM